MIPKINDLLRDTQKNVKAGTALRGTIDKNGYFYHVITQAWSKDALFSYDVAVYRDNLLGKLCVDNNITILFSVCMPNHTHEVFLTPDWATLSSMLKTLNRNVSRFIHRHHPERTRNGKRVFDYGPAYIPVKDIRYLFYLGKYIYDNPRHLELAGRRAPSSCYWMFERDHFTAGFDSRIYQTLFGLSPTEMFELYKSKTKEEIMSYAENRFLDWTEEDNASLFRRL